MLRSKMSRMPLNGVDDENEAPSFPAVQNTYVMNRNYSSIPQPNSNLKFMFALQPLQTTRAAVVGSPSIISDLFYPQS